MKADEGALPAGEKLDGPGRGKKACSSRADDTRTQAEKFEAAARELGCDEDEERFKGVLRKLARPKG